MADGRRTEVVWDRERFPYLARVHWSEGGAPLLLVQTRDQREALCLTVDTETGRTAEVRRLEDPVWIELFTGVPAWTPGGETAQKWVHVRVPGATHMAKHTRGLVARHLLGVDREPRTPAALARSLEPAFKVSLTRPERAGRPWVLDATAR